MAKSEIPTLDLSQISGPLQEVKNKPAFQKFTQELGDAMSGVGFVYLVNHGIDPKIMGSIYEKSRQFFQLPKEAKSKFKKVDAVEMFHGYTPPEDENVGELETHNASDRKEAWDCWGLESMDEANYPSEIPGFKNAFDQCKKELAELTKKLLRAFAIYLKLDDPDFFIKRHRAIDDQRIRSHNVIRSNYYMPMEPNAELPKNGMRLGEHMDWGTMTFLFQDETGGLDAKKADGSWIPVPPMKDSIILNAGLMLEMWSGGHFPATPHRVRLVETHAYKLRQSVGYFIQPDGDSNCVPLVPEKPTWNPTYPKVDKETHYEYFQDRVRATRAY
jgi:isopenicillin N synthase-like dioxygenase